VSDTALNVVMGVGLFIASTAIAIFLFARAKKEPRPVYYVTGNTVVRARAERKIEVRYRGKDVPLVTRTVVAFWNAGRQPIRRDDLVENHPLEILVPSNTEILEVRVVATTRPDIDFAVFPEIPSTKPQIGFSFLNHRDGGTVEILHTGSDPYAVSIEGAIVGVNGPPTPVNPHQWSDPLGSYVFPGILAGGFVGGASLLLETNRPLAIVFLVCALVPMGYAVRSWIRNRSRVPAALEEPITAVFLEFLRGR
jgi:hypothetical protein